MTGVVTVTALSLFAFLDLSSPYDKVFSVLFLFLASVAVCAVVYADIRALFLL